MSKWSKPLSNQAVSRSINERRERQKPTLMLPPSAEDDTVAFIEKHRPKSGPREASVERRCVTFAKSRGWKAKKIGTNGWPDHMFLRRGRVVFVEFKRESKDSRVRENQQRRIKELREEGFTVFAARSFEAFQTIFESYQ